jgi:hypothetical protein
MQPRDFLSQALLVTTSFPRDKDRQLLAPAQLTQSRYDMRCIRVGHSWGRLSIQRAESFSPHSAGRQLVCCTGKLAEVEGLFPA